MSSPYFSDLDEMQEETPMAMGTSSSGNYFSDIESEPSRQRSLLSAYPKGLIRGASKFSPIPSLGPIPEKLQERLLEQFLPTQKGQIPEEILEFTGEMTPAAALGEGGLLKRGISALSGALGKKAAKELGMPEWAQELTAGASMVAPSAIKGAIEKGLKVNNFKKVVADFLRSKGMTEEQIIPIIQNKKKLNLFSKRAMKFSRE